jgi:hypothetical protein
MGGEVVDSVTMTLFDVVRNLDTYDEDFVICARKPWSADAESVVVPFDEGFGVPAEVVARGFAYFLGVDDARETLEVFGTKPVSHDERFRCLLFYAENDAFPDWVLPD